MCTVSWHIRKHEQETHDIITSIWWKTSLNFTEVNWYVGQESNRASSEHEAKGRPRTLCFLKKWEHATALA